MRERLFWVPVGLAVILALAALVTWRSLTPREAVSVPVPKPARVPAANSPVPAPTAPTPTTVELLVISDPSGAHVWVDGRDTGLITPTLITVPAKGFMLMVLKKGYRAYVDQHPLARAKKSKLQVTLQRRAR